MRETNLCDNMNHRRRDAPVGHCPECGAVVNPNHKTARCDESKHTAARRRQLTFCVDCGTRLMSS